MGFRSMVSSTLISIAAITVGGVLTVIGIVREIRPLRSAALCLPPWASSSLSPPLYGLGVP